MLRYHLHLQQGATLLQDDEGRDFESLESARAEAIRSVRGIVAADLLAGVIDPEMQVIVADAAGVPLSIVSVGDAVRRLDKPSA